MVETQITDIRTYKGKNIKGEKETIKVNYTITLTDKIVTSVVNEYGFDVEYKSEVFEYYSKKYNGR